MFADEWQLRGEPKGVSDGDCARFRFITRDALAAIIVVFRRLQ